MIAVGIRRPSLWTMLSRDTASIIALLFLVLPLFVTGIGWLRLSGKGRSLAPEDLVWPVASIIVVPMVLVWRIRVLSGFFSRCIEVPATLTAFGVLQGSRGGRQSYVTVAYDLHNQRFHECIMFLSDKSDELGHLPAGSPIAILVDPQLPKHPKLAQHYR